MMPSLQSGALLREGQYRIVSLLGQGGFGLTYLATDTRTDQPVAIKEFFLKTSSGRDQTTGEVVTIADDEALNVFHRYKTKFLKEANILMSLDHPGIVRVRDVWEEKGTAYYAMDYIEGQALLSKVRSEGPLNEADAARYIVQVGQALDYMHRKRLNHLDVKPANIMLRKDDGAAVLIDFGTAKQYDEDGQQTSTTPVGLSHGYAPIEQYRPGGVAQFSPQTDVYALAATLYFLLSGNVPPQANALINEDLPDLGNAASPKTKWAIGKAMSLKAADRFSSVNEFISQFDLSFLAASQSDSETFGHSLVVDLGLSVKWAAWNVGASKPEEAGEYYAWGESETKPCCIKQNYIYFVDDEHDLENAHGPESDAAHVCWKWQTEGTGKECDAWRMPSQQEFQELIDKCDWIWIQYKDTSGYKVTSRINGNSIFLPAAGSLSERPSVQGKWGYYWTGTISPINSYKASYCFFTSERHNIGVMSREYGYSIRPVLINHSWEEANLFQPSDKNAQKDTVWGMEKSSPAAKRTYTAICIAIGICAVLVGLLLDALLATFSPIILNPIWLIAACVGLGYKLMTPFKRKFFKIDEVRRERAGRK